MINFRPWPRRLVGLATLLAVLPSSLAPPRAEAGGVLFVVKDVNTVGEYDAATGAMSLVLAAAGLLGLVVCARRRKAAIAALASLLTEIGRAHV